MRMKKGPKTQTDGAPVGRVAVTLDEMSQRKLRVLGEGNMSLGIRRAADVAYQRYQSQVDATPSRVMPPAGGLYGEE